MTQIEATIAILKDKGGYATLAEIYEEALKYPEIFDKEKKYKEHIRCLIQKKTNYFLKIKPGFWALTEMKDDLPDDIKEQIEESTESYFKRLSTHAKIQADLISIGKENGFTTYIPSQDKSRVFAIGQELGDIVDQYVMPQFTYQEIINKIRTMDVIWFSKSNASEQLFPKVAIEVASTTNIKNEIDKFLFLENFDVRFVLVAPKKKKALFDKIIIEKKYSKIEKKIIFFIFEDIEAILTSPQILERVFLI